MYFNNVVERSDTGATASMKKAITAGTGLFSVGGDATTLGFENPFHDEAVKAFVKDAGSLRVKMGSGAEGAMSLTPAEFKNTIVKCYEKAEQLLSEGNWLLARVQLLAIDVMIISFHLHCRGATTNSITISSISFQRDPMGASHFNSYFVINLGDAHKRARLAGPDGLARDDHRTRIEYKIYAQPGDMRFSAFHAVARLILFGGRSLRASVLATKAFGAFSGSRRDGTYEGAGEGAAPLATVDGEAPMAAVPLEGGGFPTALDLDLNDGEENGAGEPPPPLIQMLGVRGGAKKNGRQTRAAPPAPEGSVTYLVPSVSPQGNFDYSRKVSWYGGTCARSAQ